LLAADEIDALVIIYIPIDISWRQVILDAIDAGITAGRSAGGMDKPVLACLMVDEGLSQPLQVDRECIPTYAFPEAAARVLSEVADYAAWRSQPLGMFLEFDDIDAQAARDTCRKGLKQRGAGWLSTEETRGVLLALGLPVAPGGVAHSADDAVEVARSLGFPVAVKLASHQIVHKTELGGIFLHVQDEAGVQRAFEAIRHGIHLRLDCLLRLRWDFYVARARHCGDSRTRRNITGVHGLLGLQAEAGAGSHPHLSLSREYLRHQHQL
jgi:acyl-CoA synthetase (NDP forming)